LAVNEGARLRYWDDLEIGEQIAVDSASISEPLLDRFLELIDEQLAIHADAEFARGTRLRRRVVPGALVHAFAAARLRDGREHVAVVCSRWVRLDYLAPVYPGEPFSITRRLVAKEPVDERSGTCEFLRRIVDRDGKLLQIARENALILRRPGDGGDP
jgi:acyl dehydratase